MISNAELPAIFATAFAAVEVPKVKVPYLHNAGSGWSNPDWIWVWTCPKCSYRRADRDKRQLEIEINLHSHHRGPSVPWHPRYKTPPRYGRGLTR